MRFDLASPVDVAVIHREYAADFWSRVAKADGCWLWPTLPFRYGSFYITPRGYRAHRIAYAAAVGPIARGLFVCHHCDEPRCVRPDHLFLGTAKDNMRDALAKGVFHRGQRNRRHNESARQKLDEIAQEVAR